MCCILFQTTPCSKEACLGSVLLQHLEKGTSVRSKEEVLLHAKDFLDQYFGSIKR